MNERITAVKKSSLAGLAEGWGDECYALVRQASYEDMQRQDELDVEDKGATVAFQQQLVRSHFVAGKIKVWTASGEQELADMTVEDTCASIAVCDKLYADIIGFDVDPKDLRAAALAAPMPLASAGSTSQPSSEATETSPSTSPEN